MIKDLTPRFLLCGGDQIPESLFVRVVYQREVKDY